ncbi:excinuclease ABC subunit UvrA [Prevotella stercorea]|uniref:excinuclease ABC subunit UvrA n=1 Tax=Leyella stercorea TaxID=363265 RepID=UPI001F3D6C84|nr:excinuclease ABC subunit UvrA [Leyella stercorea]MCF2644150.1 excinuclease ABC subunit UvrA [Leyella stercorea]
MEKFIEVKGARVNNLKDISLRIPRDKLIVITGISGSGKSSLAFDTLYAEGQRRYVESLSSYARQYLGRMSKPECDYIKGLPPAIAVEQKVISRNPRSTVGTSTEIYEYLRLLFARIGRTYSPISGKEVKTHTVDDVLECTRQYSEGTKFAVLAPLNVVKGRTLHEQLTAELQQGYSRILYKGDFLRIDDFLAGDKNDAIAEPLYVLIDRMSVSSSESSVSRLTESVETAFYEGYGTCRLVFPPSNICYDFSTSFEEDGITFEKPTDNMFAFNSPAGACPECEGFGKVIGIDEKLVVPNTSLSVYDGCVQCWHGEKLGAWKTEFCRRAANDKFPIFEPYFNLTRAQKDMLWHGLPSDRNRDVRDRVCIDSFFQMVKENQYKIQYRVLQSRYRGKTICPVCHGTRLKKEATWVKIGGMSITELVEMSVVNLKAWFENLQLSEHEAKIGKRLLTEINKRLQFLLDVGLGYLTLNRPSDSLSGGESQRINLTTNLGSSLVGSVYILDEPSIGLHSRDTDRLIHVLRELQQLHNTVIVVEHDEDIMRAADYIIDVGPDAGRLGGEIVFEGTLDDINHTDPNATRSYTVRYLSGMESIPVPQSRRQWNHAIKINGARMNNLRGIDVTLPLNVLTVVTGVSGSGKSSLIKGILYPALKRHLNEVADAPGEYSSLGGDWQMVKHVEFVDQNPIGKSTRSNPATYIKAYDTIRQLFASQPLAKQEGYTAQYFSFNAEGGRCEECKGAGVITVEMQFMADLVLECDACHGKRFKKEILDVRFHDKNIYDVLNMTVSEAIDFFEKYGEKQIADKLQPLDAVGLGYIKLGQSSSTLSGGENQRVKLAYFIGQERQEPTLFIFDEPTTGLHFHDIHRLLKSFNTLIEKGHSIIVIEHNMDVIKCGDYVIDLGPDGGNKGGNIVCCGTPEEVAKCKASATGRYLSEKLR